MNGDNNYSDSSSEDENMVEGVQIPNGNASGVEVNEEEMSEAEVDEEDMAEAEVKEEDMCDEDINGEEENSNEVYLPNHENEKDEHLEYDESAYRFYYEIKVGWPCLSFDIIPDNLGNDRAENYPLSMTIVGGTQSANKKDNKLLVIKFGNILKSSGTSESKKTDEDESSSDDDDDDEEKPEFELAATPHEGCVNRVKATSMENKPIVASWSESGRVSIWDLSTPYLAVNDHHAMSSFIQTQVRPKPIFTFKGHQSEGYSMAWSPLTSGVLATGDCKKNIHVWKPLEAGTWYVDQRPFTGHTDSVEDIQWSPDEHNVMASCSVDKSIRIWDIRVAPNKACMMIKENAHDRDVNVISWNKHEPFILSGGDDGKIRVWDLRNFPSSSAICTFKHHTAPITSVDWHPTDSSVFAASGADDQLTLWDLSVEKDSEKETQENPELINLPSQILFIHQGQKEIKELHWHQQMPGVLLSTAQSGFNLFRTISV